VSGSTGLLLFRGTVVMRETLRQSGHAWPLTHQTPHALHFVLLFWRGLKGASSRKQWFKAVWWLDACEYGVLPPIPSWVDIMMG
jgi:hypothetical protein